MVQILVESFHFRKFSPSKTIALLLAMSIDDYNWLACRLQIAMDLKKNLKNSKIQKI